MTRSRAADVSVERLLVAVLAAAALVVVVAWTDRDVRTPSLAVVVVAGSVLAVRRWGLVALMAVPFLVGPFWAGDLQQVTGDEPHYLVIAQSVVRDRDLAVDDDYGVPPAPPLRDAHFGWDRKHERPSRYSVHQPGVGILVAPGWAVGPRRGSLVVLALATALLLREMVLLAESFGIGRRRALLATALVYAAPAVLLYGRAVFSEIVVGLVLVHLARVLRLTARSCPVADRMLWPYATAALACAWMPWLHLRYVLFAALLALMIGWRGRHPLRWAPLGALALSCLSVVLAFQQWFGSPLPTAGYTSYDHLVFTSLRSLVGLLVDTHIGVLFAAPIVVAALVAAPRIYREDRAWTATVAAGTVSYLVLAASWTGWWLGTSTPGRNWAPIAPLAVPFVARLLARAGRRAAAAVAVAGLAVGAVFLGFANSTYPDGPGGVTTLWAKVGIDPLLPTFRPGLGTTPVAVGAGLVLLVGAAVVAGTVALRQRAAAG